MPLHAAPRKAKPCAYSYPHDGHKWINPPYGRQSFSWEYCPGRTTAIGDEDFKPTLQRRAKAVGIAVAAVLVLILVIGLVSR